METFPKEKIHACVHPGQKVISRFSAAAVIVILGALFAAGIYGNQIRSSVKTMYINEYRSVHAEAAALSDAEVIALLPGMQAEIASAAQYLYWPLVVLIPILFFVMVACTMGKEYGRLHADGVKLDVKQYPQVYALFTEMAGKLGIQTIPDIFLINGNGVMNAFATCVPGYRNFVAIYSDIFDVCIEKNDMETLAFILGHELGHIRLGHSNVWYNFFNVPTRIWFFNVILGLPLTRAQEYGADKVGQLLSSDKRGKSLTILAAGRRNYATMDFEEYVKTQVESRHFFTIFHNFFQNHPVITWRIKALIHNWHGELFFPIKRGRK